MAPGYGDTSESSVYTGIPEWTFRCWRSRGQGPPYIKVGTRCYYKFADLDEFMEARRVEAGA